MSDSVAEFLTVLAEETVSTSITHSPDIDGTLAKLGSIARIIGATLRDTANPTMLKSGYKANVIPQTARGRVRLPRTAGAAGRVRAGSGRADRPERHSRMDHQAGLVRDDVRRGSGRRHERRDPRARSERAHRAVHVVGRNRRKGIRAPGDPLLRLRAAAAPPDLDFAALFHGVDERVPVDALRFGTRVMEHFLMHS